MEVLEGDPSGNGRRTGGWLLAFLQPQFPVQGFLCLYRHRRLYGNVLMYRIQHMPCCPQQLRKGCLVTIQETAREIPVKPGPLVLFVGLSMKSCF